MNKNKEKVCACLVEDCENLAEVIDFVCKNGIDILKSDGTLISGYDLIIQYYSGVLVGLDNVLTEFNLSIPDNVLQKAMNDRLKEIENDV